VDSLIFGVLWLMVFAIPWDEVVALAGVKTIAFSLGVVALVLTAARLLIMPRLRPPPLPYGLLAAFVAWSLLSFTWTIDPEQGLARMLTYPSLLAFAWLLWEFAATEKRRRALLLSYILGCWVSLAMLFVSYALGSNIGDAEEVRYTGGGLNQNDIALILNIAIPIAVYLVSGQSSMNRWTRNFHWIFILVAGIGILLTGSRTGALALVVNLAMILYFSRLGGIKTTVIFVGVVLVGSCLAFILVPQTLVERMTEGTEASTFQLRLQLWQDGLKTWKDHVVLGVGSGGYRAASQQQGGRYVVAHNLFVSVLVETGLVGIALLAGFWWMLLAHVRRLPKREKLLWFTVLLLWGIGVTTLSWEFTKTTWFLYAMILCQPAVSRGPAGRTVISRRRWPRAGPSAMAANH
jgi:O-antigen ligase